MIQSHTTISTLASSFFGREVIATNKAGQSTTYRIARLSDKLGKLEDGSEGEYLVLEATTDDKVTMSVHPRSATRLIKKGEDAGMVLVPVGVPSAPAVEFANALNAVIEDVVTTVKTSNLAAAERKADKPASTKSRFMVIYTSAVADGKTRKEVKELVAPLNLSIAGFNTYYQNAKSGKWV